MAKKSRSIPVNTMADDFGAGIAIEKISLDEATFNNLEEAKDPHREDRHSFFLLENGTVHIEIDFQKFIIKSPSVIYMHPDQVHHIIKIENITVSSWAINNENLNPDYLKLLEDIMPTKPLVLTNETFAIISEAASLCIKFTERKNDKLYHSLLKDSCNALVALVVSQYLASVKPPRNFSRFELITKVFKEVLGRNYTQLKRPANYAEKLNISTPYLNECVKNTTGFSVSYHIQHRVILEAKRLLYHSDKSVKEIAAELGYDDCPYFSRLFTKVTGTTALAFRNKNLD